MASNSLTATSKDTSAATATTSSTSTTGTSGRSARGTKSRFQRCAARLQPWRGTLTVAACCLMEFTLGVTYTSGNLMPYLTSYVRNVTNEPSVDYGEMLWVYNSGWLVVSASISFLGLLERRIPNRLYVLIGVLFNAAAFFGTYWAVQVSFVALVISYGILQGVAQSILYPNAINLGLKWFPHRKGLVAGLTMGGYGGGAFLWNQVVTEWINPHNLQPDLVLGESRYFTQPELLSRVPSCFLVLGGALISVQLLCLLSASSPNPPSPQHPPDKDGTSGTEKRSPLSQSLLPSLHKHSPDSNFADVTPETALVNSTSEKATGPTSDSDLDDVIVNCGVEGQKGHGDTLGCVKNVTEPADEEGDVIFRNGDHREMSVLPDNAVAEIPQYSPLAILKMRITWTLWLNNLNLDYAFLLIVVFYKAYGQTFIFNDHLLALVASFAAVFNCVGRPIWGLVADRVGYFPAMLLTQGTLLVTSATFVTCEVAGSSTMFFVWVCAMFTAFSGIYSINGPIIFTLFGPRNFIFVLGVISTTGFLATLTSVTVAEAVLATFGWRGLFILAACFVLCGLLILCTLSLSCGHPIPQHMLVGLRVPVRSTAHAGRRGTVA